MEMYLSINPFVHLLVFHHSPGFSGNKQNNVTLKWEYLPKEGHSDQMYKLNWILSTSAFLIQTPQYGRLRDLLIHLLERTRLQKEKKNVLKAQKTAT